MTRITRTLYEDQRTSLIISRSFLLIMRYIWETNCTENRNTHFMFNNAFWFRKSCRLWEKVEKCSRSAHATNDNMAHVWCWLTKATDTHIEYVILIAFPGYNDYTTVHCVTLYVLPLSFVKQCGYHLLKFWSIITTIRRLAICFTTICPYQCHISFFFVSVTNFGSKFYPTNLSPFCIFN